MKNEITEDQVANYQENGFLVIENFLDADELENWRIQVGEAIQQRIDVPRDKQNLTNVNERG